MKMSNEDKEVKSILEKIIKFITKFPLTKIQMKKLDEVLKEMGEDEKEIISRCLLFVALAPSCAEIFFRALYRKGIRDSDYHLMGKELFLSQDLSVVIDWAKRHNLALRPAIKKLSMVIND